MIDPRNPYWRWMSCARRIMLPHGSPFYKSACQSCVPERAWKSAAGHLLFLFHLHHLGIDLSRDPLCGREHPTLVYGRDPASDGGDNSSVVGAVERCKAHMAADTG